MRGPARHERRYGAGPDSGRSKLSDEPLAQRASLLQPATVSQAQVTQSPGGGVHHRETT